jgi:hypothetical protein
VNEIRQLTLELKQLRDELHAAHMEVETQYRQHPNIGLPEFADKELQTRHLALSTQAYKLGNQKHGLEQRLLAAAIAYFTAEADDLQLLRENFSTPAHYWNNDVEPVWAARLKERGWITEMDFNKFMLTPLGLAALKETTP